MSRPEAWPPERLAKARALFDEGMSYRTIAAALGGSHNSLIGKAQRMGWPTRGSPIKYDVERKRKAKAAPKPKPTVNLNSNSGHYAGSRETTCRWIRNDDTRQPDYCPEPRAPGKAWCGAHFRRVYVAPKKRDAA